MFKSSYDSPFGKIILIGEENYLTNLYFEGQKKFEPEIKDLKEKELKVFIDAKKWLDYYFEGKAPDFTPELLLKGSEFQLEVWEILKNIPYGKTITYKDIANKIAKKRGILKMSSQAIGGAVSRNPILIIIPCHRVIGSNGLLTGYAGGIKRKEKLLELEGAFIKNLLC